MFMAAKLSIISQSSKLFRVIMRIMSDLKASFGKKGQCHPGLIYIKKALACKASQGFTF
jgi:hypothetical protein